MDRRMGVGFIFITPRSSQVLTRAKTITIPTTFSAAVYKFFRNFVTFLMAEGAGGGSSSNWVGLQSFIFAKRIATGRIRLLDYVPRSERGICDERTLVVFAVGQNGQTQQNGSYDVNHATECDGVAHVLHFSRFVAVL